ncbi:hypothetical protein EV652_1298 [Kribbella steppae]|uniref:Uncharacterized protein n=1 Tax=Kribbella steppae TaxID=2512223 RepID=A0A4R2GST1_9ACTN|nr:hypothetical protein [Kribbella steppae]TCO12548.1 hypothetical protein EV652_1298 [Kribbella steppae]
MTEHPGEQFPPDVDPDVEPGLDPYPSEEPPATPDYDTEPGPQNSSHEQEQGERSYDEPAVELTHGEAGAEQSYVGPAEESFGAEAAGQSFGGPAAESFGEEAVGDSYGGGAAESVMDVEAASVDESTEAEAEVDSEAAFEASLDESVEADSHEAPAGHVDPAEVEFGPEFARAPGQEHEHSFAAESAVAEHAVGEQEPALPEDSAEEVVAGDSVVEEEGAHPLVEETMGRLDELRDRPVGEHAEVYADLHERLQSALVEADAETGDRG